MREEYITSFYSIFTNKIYSCKTETIYIAEIHPGLKNHDTYLDLLSKYNVSTIINHEEFSNSEKKLYEAMLNEL